MAVNETGRIVLTTHRVVIDADSEAHAQWILLALTNDGYRVHREIQEWIEKDGVVTIERSR